MNSKLNFHINNDLFYFRLQPGSRFYDLDSEYNKKIPHGDVTSDSDLSSTANIREDGYSSDCSGLSSWKRRQSSELMMGKRVLKTRQALDSNRNSGVIDGDLSDTDVELSLKSQRKNDQRKKRSKVPRYKSSDHQDGREHKRRSWTDSGVSLSLTRTDQSRCGTFENDVFSKKPKNILTEENLKSIEDDYVVPLRKTSNKSRKVSDNKSLHRLSQITTRSSLTNVSILTANSMTSLSSMSESEPEYFSDSDSSTTTDNIFARNREIDHGSKLSITSSTSTIKEDEGEIITDPQSYIDSQLKIYQERFHKNKSSVPQNTSNVPQNTPQQAKRNSIIKRVKARLRPHHNKNKNYKDVSSEFFFEKIENSKEAEDQYEVITTDVLKRLHEEESEKLDFYVDDIYYDDDLTDEENEDDGVRDDPLEKTFSGNPTKESKTFIGKFFKRTRSYSVSPQLEKKGTSGKRFSRNSLRSSIRSNPEVLFKEDRSNNVGRYTASMDNLNKTHELRPEQMNRSETFSCTPSYNRSSSFYAMDRNGFESAQSQPCMQKSTSCYGMTSHNGSSQQHSNVHAPCNVQANAHLGSIPHSPSGVLDISRFQNLQISNTQGCDCQQCLYADYLDYLEFQRFRRYYSSQNCRGPCCTPHGTTHQPMGARASNCFRSRDTELVADVIAPLQITKDTEKEAKHLKTSKYESFV